MIQIDTELIAIGDPKVIDPTAYKLAGFEELVFHRHTPEEAADHLAERIDALTLSNSGTFWHSNGDVLPW